MAEGTNVIVVKSLVGFITKVEVAKYHVKVLLFHLLTTKFEIDIYINLERNNYHCHNSKQLTITT